MNRLKKIPGELLYLMRRRTAPIQQAPLFVLGNQKSGTSAVSALLALATRKDLTLDFRVRRYVLEDLYRVSRGETSLSDFVARNRIEFSTPIIKEPSLTFIFSKLEAEFPEASFVFILRNPFDNIRSVFDRLRLDGQTKAVPGHMQNANFAWRHIISGTDLGLDPEIRTAGVAPVLATRWVLALQPVIEKPAIPVLRYEDFLGDKIGTIRSLAAKVGLDAPGSIESHVDRAFQPSGRSQVSPETFFSPENYDQIDRITAALRSRFGY